MLQLDYDYASCVRSSEKASWRLDDAMPAGNRLDFTRPFLPERLARTASIAGLDQRQQLALNQISANAYLNLFHFVEEYILAAMATHAQAEIFGDHQALRALVRFVDEELKHQQLFRRYREAFDRDAGYRCGVLESAVSVAQIILAKDPIAVLLITLHIETMTQQHYTDCVHDDEGIDPLFRNMLRLHWMEEAQHARIDALQLNGLLEHASRERVDRALEEYLEICLAFDGLLDQQAKLDADSLVGLCGAPLDEATRGEVTRAQLQAYRRMFLVYGMLNPTFQNIVGQISTVAQQAIVARAGTLE